MFSPCSELGIFMYWTCNSMNNLPSYCGLVDAKIKASDKDLPVILRAIAKAMKWISTLSGDRIFLRCFTSLIRSWTFIIHRRRFSHVKMDSIFSINFREFKKVAEVVKIWAAGLILLLLSTPAEAVNSSVNMRFFSAGEGKKISQRKSVWLLAFGKEAKPFGKS